MATGLSESLTSEPSVPYTAASNYSIKSVNCFAILRRRHFITVDCVLHIYDCMKIVNGLPSPINYVYISWKCTKCITLHSLDNTKSGRGSIWEMVLLSFAGTVNACVGTAIYKTNILLFINFPLTNVMHSNAKKENYTSQWTWVSHNFHL